MLGRLTGRVFVLSAVVAGSLVGLPTAAAQAERGGCTPGTPGVGDPYYPGYGNGGYDVRHYDLDVEYDPASDVLEGDATISARATQSLCTFDLDLVGLDVRSVKVDGRPARFSRSGQELTVDPARDLRRGHRFDVEVRYDGVPVEFTIPGTDLRTGWMSTPEGATVAGQPEVAASWFPVNDHPVDKASYSFDVTVPDGYEVAANGFLRGQHRARRGWTTWRWDADEPMASYLATVNIADWDVDRYRVGRLPAYDAVSSEITGGVRAEIDDSFSRHDEILGMLTDAFGRYPFDTVGGIVPAQEDLAFALETQTRPVYATAFWQDRQGNPRDADWVVVHELAHQWFGDDVAVAQWDDIWLNEGFATYAEWLWEDYEGRGTPAEIFQDTYDSIPADDPFWQVTIGDPGVNDLFSDPVYVRGAMTVQALRDEVGDDAFWEIVRTWASEQAGGNGSTDEFVALAEEVAGRDLTALFDAWLFTPAKPTLPTTTATAATTRAAAADTTWLADFQSRPDLPH
jgi:aminopeptidase N